MNRAIYHGLWKLNQEQGKEPAETKVIAPLAVWMPVAESNDEFCPVRLMDRMSDYGSFDGGSIPSRGT